MPRDEKVRKAQSAGVDFLELARSKAEEFLKELSRSGESAQEALDDLAKGSKRSTDRFVDAIRTEVSRQLTALGLVTKADLSALEGRYEERFASLEARCSPAPQAPPKTGGAKSAKTAAKASAPEAPEAPEAPSGAEASVAKASVAKASARPSRRRATGPGGAPTSGPSDSGEPSEGSGD
ncbi:MAG: hypothetical protein ACP5P1_10775 [Acidimicrobiales bacterium]